MKIIGQTTVLQYLLNALRSSHLSPSLLFVGIDGVGKNLVAHELAKSLLCKNPEDKTEPDELWGCQICESCLKVDKNSHPDLLLINMMSQAQLIKEKPESQTAIKIEAVRILDKFLQLKPLEGHRRIVVVEEANKLTQDAANALLKTLEEPPNNGHIILLTNDEKNLPPTILSRCSTLRFKAIPTKDLARWLNKTQGTGAEESIQISERAGGSFSHALSLLKETANAIDLSQLDLDEFFDALGNPTFRKESRERTRTVLHNLTEEARRKLEQGDLAQRDRLEILLRAAKQLDRHVSPRLILENVYLKLSRKEKEILA